MENRKGEISIGISREAGRKVREKSFGAIIQNFFVESVDIQREGKFVVLENVLGEYFYYYYRGEGPAGRTVAGVVQ